MPRAASGASRSRPQGELRVRLGEQRTAPQLLGGVRCGGRGIVDPPGCAGEAGKPAGHLLQQLRERQHEGAAHAGVGGRGCRGRPARVGPPPAPDGNRRRPWRTRRRPIRAPGAPVPAGMPVPPRRRRRWPAGRARGTKHGPGAARPTPRPGPHRNIRRCAAPAPGARAGWRSRELRQSRRQWKRLRVPRCGRTRGGLRPPSTAPPAPAHRARRRGCRRRHGAARQRHGRGRIPGRRRPQIPAPNRPPLRWSPAADRRHPPAASGPGTRRHRRRAGGRGGRFARRLRERARRRDPPRPLRRHRARPRPPRARPTARRSRRRVPRPSRQNWGRANRTCC